jgi:hypothetical protein
MMKSKSTSLLLEDENMKIITRTQLKEHIRKVVREQLREQNQLEDDGSDDATLYRYTLFINGDEWHDGEISLTDDLLEDEDAFMSSLREESFRGHNGRRYTLDDTFKDYFTEHYEEGDRSVGIEPWGPSTYPYRCDLYDTVDGQKVKSISGEIWAEWYWGY